MRSPKWRTLAALTAAGMIAAACSSGSDDPAAPDETTTDGGTGTSTETEGDGDASGDSGDAFTYKTGIFEEPTTDNFWASLDTKSTVWNSYVLNPTKSGLYAIELPDIKVSPALAAEEAPEPVQEGDAWTVTVKLKEDLKWSDGEPLTAEDVVFTFETVRDLKLGGNWLSSYPVANPETPDATGLTAVEAVDPTTVKFTFNKQPGLGVWPNQVGVAPVMPQHFWADKVEEAKGSEDPATALYDMSGAGDPSSGPVVFAELQAGAFARVEANPEYFDQGVEYEFEAAGGGSYVMGPHLKEEVLSLYGGQDPAVLALQQGEVDYLYNPLGMQRGLRDKVVGDENLTATSNATYGMRYLAFNLRKAPMNDKAFRKALATMIDREFMATNVLQGVAFPLTTAMPPSNPGWFNEEKAAEIAAPYTEFGSQEERFEAAIQILKDAGYTWESEPALETDDGGTPDDPADDVFTVIDGEGIIMPNGEPMPELELLAPGPGYDPLRSTYSVWIQQWAEDLGIPLKANPTNFNVIVDKVFVENPPTFDMYILGWSLGNPAFPDYYHGFWHSANDSATAGGNNSPGFANAEYDAAADAFLSATTKEEAYEIVWNQLEPILAEELPYVFLFDTPILEFHRSASVTYPFTQTIGGIQFSDGFKEIVQSAK